MEEAEAPVEAVAEHAEIGPRRPATLIQRSTAEVYLRRAGRSPITVAAVVLAIYGAWLIAFFGVGNHPYDMAWVGAKFIVQSHASPTIRAAAGTPHYLIGYDSQFFYYLALDPVNARYYMDVPTYRYTRVLYPLAARAMALG